jgi:hypothetical protein
MLMLCRPAIRVSLECITAFGSATQGLSRRSIDRGQRRIVADDPATCDVTGIHAALTNVARRVMSKLGRKNQLSPWE